MIRRAAAEALGTALLVAIVIGSGIQATRLTSDVGLQLLANSVATVFGLAVLILIFGPISGAHFNPVVSIADWVFKGLRPVEVAIYSAAQIGGGVAGAVLANAMFGLPAVSISQHVRSDTPLWIGEVTATAGLVLLIFMLVRTGRGALAPAAVGAYIGAAYWFTSSTSFANPAVTIGRIFSDTFAGIAPSSVPGFVIAQLVGAAIGVGVVKFLVPQPVRSVA
ncbi:aquaporin [Actinokineospora sp. HUAS TT18]|uniref:aquaporin n=1 Tax=Actinokineospora sp. HUAS TT18 TaxID=3447451 RepID=UPI003F5284F3